MACDNECYYENEVGRDPDEVNVGLLAEAMPPRRLAMSRDKPIMELAIDHPYDHRGS
jgi:hypothetical protein